MNPKDKILKALVDKLFNLLGRNKNIAKETVKKAEEMIPKQIEKVVKKVEQAPKVTPKEIKDVTEKISKQNTIPPVKKISNPADERFENLGNKKVLNNLLGKEQDNLLNLEEINKNLLEKYPWVSAASRTKIGKVSNTYNEKQRKIISQYNQNVSAIADAQMKILLKQSQLYNPLPKSDSVNERMVNIGKMFETESQSAIDILTGMKKGLEGMSPSLNPTSGRNKIDISIPQLSSNNARKKSFTFVFPDYYDVTTADEVERVFLNLTNEIRKQIKIGQDKLEAGDNAFEVAVNLLKLRNAQVMHKQLADRIEQTHEIFMKIKRQNPKFSKPIKLDLSDIKFKD